MAAGGERVALVLGGGGARGAYEAGALSVLLPELERRGQRPTIVLGTSVGALNAAFLAATAHLPGGRGAPSARRDLVRRSRYGTCSSRSSPPGSIGRAARLPRARRSGSRARAVDRARPLAADRHAARAGRLRPAAAQRRRRRVHAAAVVATSARTARSVVFHQGGTPATPRDDRRGIDYVAAELRARPRARLARAIPVLFPAVEIAERVVLRRRHAPQHAGQAGARARRRPDRRRRAQLARPGGLRTAARRARVRRRGAAGAAGRPAAARRRARWRRSTAMVADAGRPLAGRRAQSPTCSSRRSGRTRSAPSRARCSTRTTAALRDAVHDRDLVASAARSPATATPPTASSCPTCSSRRSSPGRCSRSAARTPRRRSSATRSGARRSAPSHGNAIRLHRAVPGARPLLGRSKERSHGVQDAPRRSRRPASRPARRRPS